MKDFISQAGILLFGVILGLTWMYIEQPPTEKDAALIEELADSLEACYQKLPDPGEELPCQDLSTEHEKELNELEKAYRNLNPIKTIPTYRGNSGRSWSDTADSLKSLR